MSLSRRAALTLTLGAAASLAMPTALRAETSNIVVRVLVDEQTMHVFHGGRLIHEWPVSTARAGKITPRGQWTAQWLSRNHRSSRYNNAPMPYAIFYSGHYAVHGTDQIGMLGRPASAGCVRLHPDNARILFEMARTEGLENVQIVVM
jgi:lipoprotein-anchoring transpeptidase ErfK/SrfK